MTAQKWGGVYWPAIGGSLRVGPVPLRRQYALTFADDTQSRILAFFPSEEAALETLAILNRVSDIVDAAQAIVAAQQVARVETPPGGPELLAGF